MRIPRSCGIAISYCLLDVLESKSNHETRVAEHSPFHALRMVWIHQGERIPSLCDSHFDIITYQSGQKKRLKWQNTGEYKNKWIVDGYENWFETMQNDPWNDIEKKASRQYYDDNVHYYYHYYFYEFTTELRLWYYLHYQGYCSNDHYYYYYYYNIHLVATKRRGGEYESGLAARGG